MYDAQSSVTAHEQAIEKDAEAVAAAEKEMAQAEDAVRKLTEAMGDYADGQENTAAAEAAARDALADTMELVGELADAYTEAYEEAAKSFSGQFGLFDEAKADADATVEAAQAALDTQLAYWQGYAANIAALKEISAEDLGVTQENYNALMEYVRSGTPEAAALSENMVKAWNDGNTQVLTNLADTLGQVKEAQDQAAQDVAEWTTGLVEQMDQLIRDMEEEIGELDMSEAAAESGRATIQSYVAAAADMLPQVRSTYASVAQAARRALANAVVTSSNWDGSYFSIPGHAKGTDNAPPGWAWVGEEGPELMRMHGGEQILPNGVSQQVAESYSEYQRYAAQDVPPEFSDSVSRQVIEDYREYNRYSVDQGVQQKFPRSISMEQQAAEDYREYNQYAADQNAQEAPLNRVSQEAAESYSIYNQYAINQGVQQTRPPLEVIGTGSAGTSKAKIEMHFHIEAGVLPETVNAWQDYASRGELKEIVLEVIEEADADTRRRMMG